MFGRVSFFLVSLVCVLSGCAFLGGESPASGGANGLVDAGKPGGDFRIEGSFSYRERVLPRVGWRGVVTLRDVSRADALAPLLAERVFQLSESSNGGSPPFEYELSVSRSLIKAGMQYAVRAEIHDARDTLLWTTDRVVLIDADGEDQRVDPITLVQVSRSDMRDDRAIAVLGEREWHVEEVGGVPVLAESPPTISFADGLIAGSTGCNRYSGPVRLGPDNALSVSMLAVTRRACMAAIGDQENRFLRALRSSARFKILRGEVLSLMSVDADTADSDDEFRIVARREN